MDNRLLIGFGGFLAVFLLFPFVAQMLRDDAGNSGTNTPGVESTTTGGADGRSRIPDEPPLLNTQNLIGTEWTVRWEQYDIRITIAANGVLYATHPLMRSVTGMDYFEGRWRIEYDTVYVHARFGDEVFDETLYVAGNNLYDRSGNQIQRL